MTTFKFDFTVDATVTAVSDFHHDTSILKKLTPPPIYTQIHSFEPLGEGSVANFTLWVGPIPLRWTAVHSNVSVNGFTDTQQSGPMKSWAHTHRFTAVSPTKTQVSEHIEYSHHSGLKGLFTRLLFNNAGLYLLFTARKLITRYHVGKALRITA